MATHQGSPVSIAALQDNSMDPAADEDALGNQTNRPASRFSLLLSAKWWRSLQYIGMALHYCAPPRPPSPNFTRVIPCTLSGGAGEISLLFYLPKDYFTSKDRGAIYPTVVNFHGGGFTIGSATDDARFGRFVLDGCNAIFISVEYRLAPEHPFPTAVDDGADALLYVIRHAAELRIDRSRIATSGFSAGGNIAFTAMLRLASVIRETQPARSTVPDHQIVAVMAWYPIVDSTLSRVDRRATAVNPARTLPSTLTDLFDAAYYYPPDMDLANPYASPAKAADELLARVVPPKVRLYTCEFDMLRREGEEFARRLANPPIGKDVTHVMIPGVEHGWDRSPNPWRPAERSGELYGDCAEWLKDVFGGG